MTWLLKKILVFEVIANIIWLRLLVLLMLLIFHLKKVVGLSKLARVAEAFSKRLQTQERLTMQIAKTIMDVLQPRGVAVTIDAVHQCMTDQRY